MNEARCIDTTAHLGHTWPTSGRIPIEFRCPGVSAKLASQFKHGKNCGSCGKRLVEAAIRAEDDYCDTCNGD